MDEERRGKLVLEACLPGRVLALSSAAGWSSEYPEYPSVKQRVSQMLVRHGKKAS